MDFLELLFAARSETYSIETIKKAWDNASCWPIDMDKALRVLKACPSPEPEIVPESAPESVCALETPLLIRKLACETRDKMLAGDLDNGIKRSLFDEFVDITTAKLTTYHDIAPRATTLNKLRSSKTRAPNRGSRQVGNARVLSRQVLNEGLKKLELAKEAKAQHEDKLKKRKILAEERKQAKEELERQWKWDCEAYRVQMQLWHEDCTAVESIWKEKRDEARNAHKRPPRKFTLPERPKRPIKPKGGGIGDQPIIKEEDEVGPGARLQDVESDAENAEEELVDNMRTLELDRFAEIV